MKHFTMNPIALRELRQLVRAKTILFGVVIYPMVLFFALWMSLSDALQGKSAVELVAGPGLGSVPFSTISIVTGLIMVVGVPGYFAAKTIREASRDDSRLEFTTLISPTQYITGKLTAGFLLMLVALALSLPFTAVAYLLRGVDLSTALLTPAILLAYAVVSLSIILMMATSTLHKSLKGIAILILLLIVLPMTFTSSGIFAVTELGSSVEAIIVFSTMAVVAATVARAYGASNVAPPYSHRVGPLRRTELILLAADALVIGIGSQIAVTHKFDDYGYLCTSIAAILATICCGRSAFDPEIVSRSFRLTAKAHPRTRILRLLTATGSAPGVLFSMMYMTVALALPLAFLKLDNDFYAVIATFFFEFGGAAVVFGSVARSVARTAKGLKVGFMLFLVAISALNTLAVFMAASGGFGDSESALAMPLCIAGIVIDKTRYAHFIWAAITGLSALLISLSSLESSYRTIKRQVK